jgi:hypothetical protein
MILKGVTKEMTTISVMMILWRKGNGREVGVVRKMMMKEKMRIVRSVSLPYL